MSRSLFGSLSIHLAYEAFTVRKSHPLVASLNYSEKFYISFGLIVHCLIGNAPFCNKTTTALSRCNVDILALLLPPPLSQIIVRDDLRMNLTKPHPFNPGELSKCQISAVAF